MHSLDASKPYKASYFDFFLGVLLAVPIAYPKEPYYWLAIIIFMVSIPRARFNREGILALLLVLLFSLLTVLINVFSPMEENVYYFSALATVITLYFYVFQYMIQDERSVLSGFSIVGNFYSIAVIIAFFTIKPYLETPDFMSNSLGRMWAEGLFPEWPNVFCVFILSTFFINFIKKQYFWSVFNLAAAFLTTSRMVYVAIFIVAVYITFNSRYIVKYLFIIFCFSCLMGILVLALYNQAYLDYFLSRVLKFGDRAIIFRSALESLYLHPLGIGNVPFGAINDYYESYHSSYLKVLVRYGVFGLCIYLLIVKPANVLYKVFDFVNMPILFILIISLFQDMLLHLHLMMLFSCFIKLRTRKLVGVRND